MSEPKSGDLDRRELIKSGLALTAGAALAGAPGAVRPAAAAPADGSIPRRVRELCLAKAHELGMGILAMKVLGGMAPGGATLSPGGAAQLAPDLKSERLEALPAAAIRWVLEDSRVHLLCIGQGSAAEIEANIRTLSLDTRLTERDRVLLARFASQAYPAYEKRLAARTS